MATQQIQPSEPKPLTPPPVDSLPHKGRSYWGSTTILGAVCLIVVGVHVGGLNSLMQFVGEREAWTAGKRQVEQQRSEWQSLFQTYKKDVTAYKADAAALKTNSAELEEKRTQLAEEVSALQGQHDALISSRDAALALERRARQDEQTARDAEQAAKTEVAALTKQKTSLEDAIRNQQSTKDQLAAAVLSARETYKRQSEQLTAHNTDLKALDDRLIEQRTEIRTRSDELVKLSADVNKLQQDKMRATEGLADLADQKQSTEKLQSERAKLEGEIAAHQKLLTDLEKDLSKQQQLLAKAKTTLAPYYLDVENREQIKTEIADLDTEHKKLREFGRTVKSGLDDLKADVAGQEKLLEDIRKRVISLRSEEEDLVGKVLSMSKAIKEQSEPTNDTDEKPNGEKDVTAGTATENE